jgi:ABC-type multidrug transport system fused ATPase/permease subunit
VDNEVNPFPARMRALPVRNSPSMEKSFFRYILRHSWRQQGYLLALTLISFPFLYLSLELPKRIVNQAIGSEDFPRSEFGVEFDQIHYLFVLCAIFLLLVAINGGLKYVVNVYKGRLGERMLRRLRYELFGRVLRFPLPRFRRVSQGEIVSMITGEVEPLGGFIGDAFALPAFQGGTLLTILAFMFVQDWVLGVAAVALYPLQMYLIPKLQRQVNLLAKERVRTVRRLSERIGEAVSNVEEIHVHDTAEMHRAEFSLFVGKIYDIRFSIYKKKFFIKFLNNFLAQLGPFFFFSIGGYLVITGDLTFGALVAVLAAHKDLSAPWKELLQWYQQKEDAKIKYEQLIEQFAPPDILAEALQQPLRAVAPLQGEVVASHVTVEEEGGVKLLEAASFRFSIGEHVAFVGASGSGAETAARVLARLVPLTSGSVRIGAAELSTLPEAVTGRRMAYVGATVGLAQGTLRDNLLYALKHRPKARSEGDSASRARAEALATGSTTSDLDADWLDYDAAGVDGEPALATRAMQVLQAVALGDDVFSFGLNGAIDAAARPDLAGDILRARGALRQRLQEARYRGLVEPFERDRFNQNMSIAENLLFGRPVGEMFDLEHIGDNAYVRAILDRVGLSESFQQMGLQIAGIMVDLFEGLPPEHEFFERYSFVDQAQLPELRAVVRRIQASDFGKADASDVSTVMALPFKVVPARHRLGVLDTRIEQHIVSARAAFARDLPDAYRAAIIFFEENEYNAAASIQDNILFGKIAFGRQHSQAEITQLISSVIETLGLRASIMEAGLDYDVGVGGRRLSAGQRQKLGLARAILKRPDLLILDQALAALDHRSRAVVEEAIHGEDAGIGIVMVLGENEPLDRFDRIVRFEAGMVADQRSASDAGRRSSSSEAEDGPARPPEARAEP